MNCIYCNNPLPEKGFYCPSCTKQVKCKKCSDDLIKDAKICVNCGELVAQAEGSTFNTIEFSEGKQGRSFKASFTNEVGNSIGEAFGLILSNRLPIKKPAIPGIPYTANKTNPDQAIDAEVLPDEQNLPEIEKLKSVIKIDGDKATLQETRLKAKSKRDYFIRLTLLFLYYKSLLGEDKVPRKQVTYIVDNASVEDANFRHWLIKNPNVSVEGDMVEIKAPGKDAAKQFLAEVYNSEIKDGWKIGSQAKTGRKPKEKKSDKK